MLGALPIAAGNTHTSFAFEAIAAETSLFVQLCKPGISQRIAAVSVEE